MPANMMHAIKMAPLRVETELHFGEMRTVATFTTEDAVDLRDKLVALFGPGEEYIDKDSVEIMLAEKSRPPKPGTWIH